MSKIAARIRDCTCPIPAPAKKKAKKRTPSSSNHIDEIIDWTCEAFKLDKTKTLKTLKGEHGFGQLDNIKLERVKETLIDKNMTLELEEYGGILVRMIPRLLYLLAIYLENQHKGPKEGLNIKIKNKNKSMQLSYTLNIDVKNIISFKNLPENVSDFLKETIEITEASRAKAAVESIYQKAVEEHQRKYDSVTLASITSEDELWHKFISADIEDRKDLLTSIGLSEGAARFLMRLINSNLEDIEPREHR